MTTLSVILLVIGSAGLLGTSAISLALRTMLYRLVIAIPMAMAAVALALIIFWHCVIVVGVILVCWGLTGTAAPVAWWTWLSKALPDDAEAGGGLMVAVIQMAIAAGA